MQNDPFVEWQRLTGLYGVMYDGELLNLAADSADLTDTARQVLHDEMKKRGLDEPSAAGNASNPSAPLRGPATAPPDAEEPDSEEEAERESDLPHDYTWKTLLCECNEPQQAQQICAVLRQVGIECWIERPGSYSPHSQLGNEFSPYSQLDLRNPRILVAADRLDEARTIIARPIPQEFLDQSQTVEPDFQSPVCPKCGSADPVLEGVDPFNSWRCDSCGKQWTESAGASGSALEVNPENPKS
jgi:hypothetical protein